MSTGWRARLIALHGWPRRTAALLCLTLALLAATGRHRSASADRPLPAAGQVAVRVELADGGADERFLRPGDRVDLIAGTPGQDASTGTASTGTDRIENVRVLEVRPPPSTGLTGDEREPGTVLIVSADASQADVITTLAERPVLAAQDKQP